MCKDSYRIETHYSYSLSYIHIAKSFCKFNYIFVLFLSSNIYYTIFLGAVMWNNLNVLNKFPSIILRITRVSMSDPTASKKHLIPDHTTSMRHPILDYTTRIWHLIPYHIARIRHLTSDHKISMRNHQITKQVWGISLHRAQKIVSSHYSSLFEIQIIYKSNLF